MSVIFFAIGNKGKQEEITRFAEGYGNLFSMRFPDENQKLDIAETGKTFEENATLKAQAYRQKTGNDQTVFVGDDSGVKIPALNNEPGVFTRRWAGHEMTDQEIVEYCLEKMKYLRGDDRKAMFETTLAAAKGSEVPQIFRGQMWGRILEEPTSGELIEGFPFRSLFWVDELDCPMYKIHNLPIEDRQNFLTHREEAFQQLFNELRH